MEISVVGQTGVYNLLSASGSKPRLEGLKINGEAEFYLYPKR